MDDDARRMGANVEGVAAPPRAESAAGHMPHARSESPHSGSASPPKRGRAPSATPRLVTDLPLAEEAAKATYEEIPDCTYQTSKLGRTRGQDDPSCECTRAHGLAFACTDESGCINRLTQVECLADVCRCGSACQNQRYVVLFRR